ncbi:hypothetical protein EMWEY_00054590 [Eimeria maxima]|uniref:P-type ATPase C-terminal domain-containing protein n=1 Tax=Eimeria maxima TaxID=5804 RepID=U6M479_EIMMA|nr:hypothetical protein EMWEY_00054590 [Eimeria maxima]CDJ56495.1 hypothetical protein EMWEY_00054590 [Eimeria maxima]
MLLYDMFKEARILKRADEHICLVVTGPNLTAFLNHPDLQTCFLNMACCCDVVVAARVTATQKADMVRLVKKRLTPQPITLAIGDGGNDAPMLQEASVGVAVRTERGTSIAGFADFAISEFSLLISTECLLVSSRGCLDGFKCVTWWAYYELLLLWGYSPLWSYYTKQFTPVVGDPSMDTDIYFYDRLPQHSSLYSW